MNLLTSASSDVMIEFHGVTKRYGSVTAVDQVSFQMRHGEICGFLGPNGAGKTTSLRMLLGLVHPSAGTITIEGVDVHQDPVRALDGVGAIIEESQFYPYLTGEQNLRQVLRLRGLDVTPQALRERLEAVGLADAGGRRAKGYSLGMRQRLALALALLQNPRILVLDEPMNGLDPEAIRDVRSQILRLAESGVTILLSSHILSEVEQLATRLVFINHGRVVGMENRGEAEEAEAYVRVTQAAPLATWLESQGRKAQVLDDGAFVIPLTDAREMPDLIRAWVYAGIELLEVRPYAANLELQYLEHMAIAEEGSSYVGV